MGEQEEEEGGGERSDERDQVEPTVEAEANCHEHIDVEEVRIDDRPTGEVRTEEARVDDGLMDGDVEAVGGDGVAAVGA